MRFAIFGIGDVTLQFELKFQLLLWYVLFTQEGTAPVSMLLSRYSVSSRVSRTTCGIGPVNPMLDRRRYCSVERTPMAVGIGDVLVHEDALTLRYVTLYVLQSHCTPLHDSHHSGRYIGTDVLYAHVVLLPPYPRRQSPGFE